MAERIGIESASCYATQSSLSPPDLALLKDLASLPRPTGGDAIAAARARCTRELEAMGYRVSAADFEFSELVGRLGTPLIGGAAALIVGLAGSMALAGARTSPLLILGTGALALFVLGRWMLKRGVLVAPVLRQHGTNLMATRSHEPAVWLCAHLDSKSQPIPTFLRTTSIILEGIGFVATTALAIATALGASVLPPLWAVAGLVTLAGAALVVFCVVGERSPGALDNASGVVTVIEAARQMKDESRVGVLITDAEELALAGARAWGGAKGRHMTTVLNCDGVDDLGDIHVMYSSTRPERVMRAAGQASRLCGVPHVPGRLAFGILTDSVAFTDASVASVTFSRGTLRSLLRVHSSRDDLEHLRGTGIAETATLMAATARELLETRA